MAKEEKRGQHADFSDSGFFALRTPALPFDDLLAWSDGLKASPLCTCDIYSECIAHAWQADVRLLRGRLGEISQRPEIALALFVASPSLQLGIQHWKRDPEGKKGLQAERALVRYFTRMCTRSTPFGLFSGCSVGRIAETGGTTDLRLTPRNEYRVYSRLDFDYLIALTEGLRSDPGVRASIRYSPNPSLHKLAGAWRYVQVRLTGSVRTQHYMQITDDPCLDVIVKCPRTEAVPAEWAEVLLQGAVGEMNQEKAESYIQELIRYGVLVSSLSPLITGGSPDEDIIAQVEGLPFPPHVAQVLRRTRDRMTALERKGVAAPVEEYRSIAAELETLPAKVNLARLYQVDLMKPLEGAVITKPVIDEIFFGADVLCRLGERAEPAELRTFRENFVARYERAWIPLLEALDEDVGVGFGLPRESSPLLLGLPLSAPYRTEAQVPNPFLLQKIVDCASQGQAEMELQLSDLSLAGRSANTLPDSFSVTATIAARSEEAVRAGQFQLLLNGVWGPNGVRYLTRFCYADSQLEQLVRNHIQQEEAYDSDALYAEIVDVPEEGRGNVLWRPVMRQYELVHLGRSGAPSDRQLRLSDLLVSVDAGRIILYSQLLRRRIIPRLTNPHGYQNPQLDPVYRFLGFLQRQQGAYVGGFSWGALGTLGFTPRLRIGRLVLAPAHWRLRPDEISNLAQYKGSRLFFEVQKLRRRRHLPRWIVLQEQDQGLPVDLDNALSVDAFVHVLKRQPQATLQELYPLADGLCVTSPEGGFCHELQVPFVRRPGAIKTVEHAIQKTHNSIANAAIVATGETRAVSPGRDWLYLKIYSGVDTLDTILARVLPPVIRVMRASGLVSRWFFLRFYDPYSHLRVRFNGASGGLTRELLPLLCETLAPLVAEGSIWKFQFDTYQREIERYGGVEGAQVAEDIFFADSEAVLNILEDLGGEGLDLRWQIGLLGIDRLLSDCGFDAETKRAAVARWRRRFQSGFQSDSGWKRELSEKFRQERRRLESLLEKSPEGSAHWDIAKQSFDCRSTRNVESMRQLRWLCAQGKLTVDIPELVSSYAHLHTNRLIRSSQRAHEFVLYDFLFQLYNGRLEAAASVPTSTSASLLNCVGRTG